MQQESKSELLNGISQTKQHVIQLQENYRNYQALLPKVSLLKWWQHLILWFILLFAFAYLIDFITWPIRAMLNIGEASDFFFILFLIVYTVVYIIGYTKYARYKEKKANESLERHASLIHELEEEKEQLLQGISNSIVPEAYCSIHALASLEQYIQNSRADSLKEAINLYEQELRHEEHMREIHYLKQLQHETYRKAQEASTIGWINFFTKR